MDTEISWKQKSNKKLETSSPSLHGRRVSTKFR